MNAASPPELPWNAYGPWLRVKYGAPVHRISIDGGFSCPNRDGSRGRGGCAYCSVDSFVPADIRRLPSIARQVELGAQKIRARHGDACKFILYFQANTNTYAPVETLRSRYDEALAAAPRGTVELAVGTRPDCLEPEKLELLSSYADRLDVTVELGLESMHDATLERVNRGHTHAEFLAACRSIRGHPLTLGLHAIFGFPWESSDDMLRTADLINETPARFLKIHQLHVVEGSAMAAQYRREAFPLMTLEAWAEFLADFLPRLRPDLVIQRLVANTPARFLIAPPWAAKSSEALAFVEAFLRENGVRQGSRFR
jgi:hypothetical protein